MLGYSKDKFGCWISGTDPNIAYVTLCDKEGEKSYMEIPVKELKDNNIVCEIGSIFCITIRSFFKWEKIAFEPASSTVITKKDVEKLRKYYEEKYGDV